MNILEMMTFSCIFIHSIFSLYCTYYLYKWTSANSNLSRTTSDSLCKTLDIITELDHEIQILKVRVSSLEKGGKNA